MDHQEVSNDPSDTSDSCTELHWEDQGRDRICTGTRPQSHKLSDRQQHCWPITFLQLQLKASVNVNLFYHKFFISVKVDIDMKGNFLIWNSNSWCGECPVIFTCAISIQAQILKIINTQDRIMKILSDHIGKKFSPCASTSSKGLKSSTGVLLSQSLSLHCNVTQLYSTLRQIKLFWNNIKLAIV